MLMPRHPRDCICTSACSLHARKQRQTGAHLTLAPLLEGGQVLIEAHASFLVEGGPFLQHCLLRVVWQDLQEVLQHDESVSCRPSASVGGHAGSGKPRVVGLPALAAAVADTPE